MGKTIYAIDGVFFKKYSRLFAIQLLVYQNENMDVRLK
jgi:hypothetical protein